MVYTTKNTIPLSAKEITPSAKKVTAEHDTQNNQHNRNQYKNRHIACLISDSVTLGLFVYFLEPALLISSQLKRI